MVLVEFNHKDGVRDLFLGLDEKSILTDPFIAEFEGGNLPPYTVISEDNIKLFCVDQKVLSFAEMCIKRGSSTSFFLGNFSKEPVN